MHTSGVFGALIRLGARLRGRPHRDNHVAIVVDAAGGIVEARPEGVRRGSISEYSSKYSLTNVNQPKTTDQRSQVAAVALSLLDHGYDWAAISADVTNVFDIDDPLVKDWADGTTPARFVCSSLAAYVYTKAGLDCPKGGRFCTPGDWARFVGEHGFSAAPGEPDRTG
ncbi:MAG: hypothetical protein ACRDRL_30915 [Sciscionella sp.]